MGLKITQLALNLPFGIGGVTVQVTEAQQKAAWALYVQYATRITTQELKQGEGSIREALNSIHSLFDITRQTLISEGPGAAEGAESVGPFAISILNNGVRPFLVKWHTLFSAFENEQKAIQQRELGAGIIPVIDDNEWDTQEQFYSALSLFRKGLAAYVSSLGEIAGVIEQIEVVN